MIPVIRNFRLNQTRILVTKDFELSGYDLYQLYPRHTAALHQTNSPRLIVGKSGSFKPLLPVISIVQAVTFKRLQSSNSNFSYPVILSSISHLVTCTRLMNNIEVQVYWHYNPSKIPETRTDEKSLKKKIVQKGNLS